MTRPVTKLNLSDRFGCGSSFVIWRFTCSFTTKLTWRLEIVNERCEIDAETFSEEMVRPAFWIKYESRISKPTHSTYLIRYVSTYDPSFNNEFCLVICALTTLEMFKRNLLKRLDSVESAVNRISRENFLFIELTKQNKDSRVTSEYFIHSKTLFPTRMKNEKNRENSSQGRISDREK